MELNHFQSELSDLEKATCKADTQYNNDKSNLTRLQAEIDKFKVTLS